MTPLQSFLIEAAKEIKNVEIHLNGRLHEQTFIIKGLTLDELNDARKRAINPNGKGSERLNGVELTKNTIIAGCVEPNFKNEDFVKACGCITPSEVVGKVLLAGEATELSREIMKASGYDDDNDDDSDKLEKAKDEAKN